MVGVFFRPDLVLPNDPPGFGRWRIGHYLEHKLLITQAQSLAKVTVPDYDLGFWSDDAAAVRVWLDVHNRIHQVLDGPAGISSIDWSAVDLTDEAQWNIWMQDHAVEHGQLRSAYRIAG